MTLSLDDFNNLFDAAAPAPLNPAQTPPVVLPQEPEGAEAVEAPRGLSMFAVPPVKSEQQVLIGLEGLEEFNRLFPPKESMGGEIMAIPVAFPTGARAPVIGAHIGLNRAAVYLNPISGLQVTLQAYPNMLEGDRIELYWHPADVPTPIPLRTEGVSQGQIGQNIITSVPVQDAVTGFAEWYVKVVRAGSENVEESRRLTLFYKDTLPGGRDLRPNEPWHSELLAAAFELPSQLTPDVQIPVTVQNYPFMREYDVITLSIGGVFFTYTVQPAEVDNPVTIMVSGADLEAIKDLEQVQVVWKVHDEVHNLSEKWSAAVIVDVEFDDGTLLAIPTVWVQGESVETELELERLGSADALVRIRSTAPGFRRGDQITVHYEIVSAEGQSFVRELTALIVGNPNIDYDTAIPNADLQRAANGQLRVSYTLRRNGVQVGRSMRRNLIVRGVVTRLPAPIVVEADALVLPGDLNRINIKIGWPGMVFGDRGLLVLNGTTAGGQPFERAINFAVSGNEAREGVKQFTVDENFASLNGGTLAVRYEVLVNSGGSLTSKVLNLLVGAQIDLLPAPTVEGLTSDNLLPPGSLGRVSVLYAGMAGDHTVSLSWRASTAAASFEDKQLAFQSPLHFNIPSAVIAEGLHQVVRVFYTVRDRNGRVRLSGETTLIIAPDEPVVLSAPVSPQAQNGQLDPARVPVTPGAIFTVNYTGMLPRDQVELHFSSPAQSVVILQTVDRPGLLTFHVPRSVILANLGQPVQVHYVAIRGKVHKTSPQLSLSITGALSIMPNDMILDGVSIKMPWPRTGLDSLGNTGARQPTGGIAPYTYRSLNPAVASVDARGKVTGNRRGTARIVVSDQAGTEVFYQATVSNTYTVAWTDSTAIVSTAQAQAWRLGQNVITVNVSAVQDMLRVYRRTIPAFTHNIWLGALHANMGISFFNVATQWGLVPTTPTYPGVYGSVGLRPL